MESIPSFRLDKKRTLKTDRKLSPLNPQAAIVRETDSPPASPQTTLSPFSDDSLLLKKRSIGVSLRRLATEKVVADKLIDAPFEPKFKSIYRLIRHRLKTI
jgi:hypothetical protein